MKMKLASNLEIDLTAQPYDTQGLRVFIAGISGAGKSYAQMKFIEEAHDAGLQFVLLDVHGEGHVLSELSDNVVVASERFGIPVDIEAVDIYVDILESGMSLVIDLKSLYWEARDRFLEFTYLFLRKFMARWSNLMRPVLVAMDEAQEIAPQTQTKGTAELVKVVSEIVTGGRKSGVHILLASQRPAKIDKTPISQANVRLIGQLTATQDWNAIKEYTKGFSFQDLRGFRSGDFICVTEGTSKKIHINERRTKDAGKTPTVAVQFSTVQRKDMKEIAERIAAAIEASKQGKERETSQAEHVKSLEKRLESRDEKVKELEAKLDMVEFVAEKFGGARVRGKVEVPSELVDVKSEFERELKKLSSRMQRELSAKDTEILELRKHISEFTIRSEKFEQFRGLFREVFGNGSGQGNGVTVDEDAIVARVIARVGNGGSIYQVAPLEALKKDWEQRIHASVVQVIDSLTPDALKILSYLIASGQRSKTAICQTLWNADGGSAFKKVSDALSELSGKKVVYSNQRGYGSRIEKVVEEYMNGLLEDPSHITEHIIEHVRQKGGIDSGN